MRKEIRNTDENKSEEVQRDFKNDVSEAKRGCWNLPCCEDHGPNGPGGNIVEGVAFGDKEIINWGIDDFKIHEMLEKSEMRKNKVLWKDTGGEEINIAVLDTGIALNHFDFFDRIPDNPQDIIADSILNMNDDFINTIVKWRRGFIDSIFVRPHKLPDAILKCKDFTGSPFGVLDIHGHGTHVAGIIAARKNGIGVVGVAPKAKLLIGKVLGDTGGGSHRALAKGIRWAIKQKAHIISMSLGSSEKSKKVQRAIEKAQKKGIFLICSAGNKIHKGDKGETLVIGDREKYSLEYPAKFPETIAVGAIKWKSGKTYYSLEKDQEGYVDVDIVAPGNKIISSFPPQICYPGHICAVLSGSSMAAAFVSGVAALILAKHRKHGGETPVKNRDDLIRHLKTIAVDINSIKDDHDLKEGYLFEPDSIDKKHQTFSSK